PASAATKTGDVITGQAGSSSGEAGQNYNSCSTATSPPSENNVGKPKAYAHATVGGVDTARLEDLGNDYTIDRETSYTRLRDVDYYLKARYFEELTTDLGREQGTTTTYGLLRANFSNTGTGKTWTDGNFDPWEADKVWLSQWSQLRATFSNTDYTAAGV
ncbi:MAG: hypothetical protein HQ567_06425, partial [Candidatus Nealsonbacteria bacterium]|nr:hypothetical protein [Candidatus Nealsonbacteria bacterium]